MVGFSGVVSGAGAGGFEAVSGGGDEVVET